MISWSDVGVWEFRSSFKGVGGVLKILPSDFVVNEIRQDGSLVEFSAGETPEGHSTGEYLQFVLHKAHHTRSTQRLSAAGRPSAIRWMCFKSSGMRSGLVLKSSRSQDSKTSGRCQAMVPAHNPEGEVAGDHAGGDRVWCGD